MCTAAALLTGGGRPLGRAPSGVSSKGKLDWQSARVASRWRGAELHDVHRARHECSEEPYDAQARCAEKPCESHAGGTTERR